MSFVALIPPCAQTLWLRRTGIIENRSTLTPSSANLIVHANPASPPPTTITRLLLGIAMISLPHLFAHLGAFLVNEIHVVLEVVHDLFQVRPDRNRPALVVRALAPPRLLRQLAQHGGEELAVGVEQRDGDVGGLVGVEEVGDVLVLVVADQRGVVLGN